MRIIADAKDYFDCMQATDEDHKTLYIRSPGTIQLKDKWLFPHVATGKLYWRQSGVATKIHIVGFCGKIYPVVHLSRWDSSFTSTIQRYCHSMVHVDNYMSHNLAHKELEEYLDKSKKNRAYWGFNSERQFVFQEFFDECAKQAAAFPQLFEKRPIFVATRHTRNESELTYDALLKPLEFFRVMSPPQAYQELTMFLNNLAVPMKPIPKLDDVTLAESKGFDRFSFRQDPIRKRKK